MNSMKNILQDIKNNFTDLEFINEGSLHAIISISNAPAITSIVSFLKKAGFVMLMDICGVDYPSNIKRFEVVYQLLNLEKNLRLTLKVQVSEGEEVESITAIHSAAGWFERETFDMYGVIFKNHPDLRRILTDYNFEGFPLRKDFPLTGFTEIRYDATSQKIVEDKVNLSQEYRNFDFEMPWESVQYSIKKK